MQSIAPSKTIVVHCYSALHKDSRRGDKWLDAERLRRAGDAQQATKLQKQHEQVQQQIQAAEQQLEAALTGKAESEQQLLSAQQGLDRYNHNTECVCRHHAAVCCAELCQLCSVAL